MALLNIIQQIFCIANYALYLWYINKDILANCKCFLLQKKNSRSFMETG